MRQSGGCNSRDIQFTVLGSIAEASLQLHGVFEAAQRAADECLNVAKKQADEHPDAAQKRAEETLDSAQRQAEAMESAA